MKTKRIPFSVTFFPNGMAAVGDADGNQIGQYQGRHKYTVDALAEDGYDWAALPDVLGVPNCCQPWESVRAIELQEGDGT